MSREVGKKLIAQNKKARHDYSLGDKFEAGIQLVGTEVKSLRAGRASLVDGFAEIRNGEAWLRNVHIPEYEQGSWTNHEPRRARKLLLKKEQIRKIIKETKEKGTTIIPLSLYFKDGFAKVELAIAIGKQAHDKRQSIAARDAAKEAARAMGRRNKGDE
ncbi:MAG: SsrA-binding protein SmpB [Actinomycetota bacterium]|nr:SsrA-binding protein SmpB [Actinomycetota bacterium]